MGQANQPSHAGKPAGFPRRFGKYTLLSHLATGGMADVFLARQLGPAGFEKECVIKRILPHLTHDPNNQSFIDMFLDEARIAARLSHPNIVHIFDLGQVDGDYFLALEYVDGIDIESMLDRTRQAGQAALPWPIAVRIVSNVAEGLEHVHKAKDSSGSPLLLVHRDISPSNIMVSWDGVAKVLDFGIAKVMAASGAKVKTGAGIIKGKVPYMSPEQIQGLDLDGRSDVFSLGVVLYEMTTGQRPFPGDTTGQLTVQIAGREPRPPSSLNPAFPPDLWPVLQRALAKPVDKRYQSARDFKLDLEQFLQDQLVSCTNYDVEAYLRELVPNRPRRELPSAEEIARVEAEAALEGSDPPIMLPQATATSQPSRNAGRRGPTEISGPTMQASVEASSVKTPLPAPTEEPRPLNLGSRGDQPSGPGIDVLEAENVAEQRRHRQGKGGGMLMGAIFLLVIVTGVIFYVLHERALQGTNAAPAAATAAPTPPPPAPPPATTAKAETEAASATQPAGNSPLPSEPNAPMAAAPTAGAKKTGEKKPDPTEAVDKTVHSEKQAGAESETATKSKPKPRTRKKPVDDDAPAAPANLPLPPPLEDP